VSGLLTTAFLRLSTLDFLPEVFTHSWARFGALKSKLSPSKGVTLLALATVAAVSSEAKDSSVFVMNKIMFGYCFEIFCLA
jgi:hypothetical protein